MLSHRWKDQVHLLVPSSLVEFLHVPFVPFGEWESFLSACKPFDFIRSKFLLTVERNNHPPSSRGVCFCLRLNKSMALHPIRSREFWWPLYNTLTRRRTSHFSFLGINCWHCLPARRHPRHTDKTPSAFICIQICNCHEWLCSEGRPGGSGGFRNWPPGLAQLLQSLQPQNPGRDYQPSAVMGRQRQQGGTGLMFQPTLATSGV